MGLEQRVASEAAQAGNLRDEILQIAHLGFLGRQAVFFLGANVDAPARKARGQFGVLPLAADGDGQVARLHDDFRAFFAFVQDDFADFRRIQRRGDEGPRIGAVGDDVDALVFQLAHHHLHTRAFHADAGAHRIDIGAGGRDGDFGADPGFARHADDFDDAFADLGHFLLEELDDQVRIAAR